MSNKTFSETGCCFFRAAVNRLMSILCGKSMADLVACFEEFGFTKKIRNPGWKVLKAAAV